jgi:hypothetical protein
MEIGNKIASAKELFLYTNLLEELKCNPEDWNDYLHEKECMCIFCLWFLHFLKRNKCEVSQIPLPVETSDNIGQS